MIATARVRERSYVGILTITTNLTKGQRKGLRQGRLPARRRLPVPRLGADRPKDGQRPLPPFSGTGRALRGRDCTKLHHPQESYGPRS